MRRRWASWCVPIWSFSAWRAGTALPCMLINHLGRLGCPRRAGQFDAPAAPSGSPALQPGTATGSGGTTSRAALCWLPGPRSRCHRTSVHRSSSALRPPSAAWVGEVAGRAAWWHRNRRRHAGLVGTLIGLPRVLARTGCSRPLTTADQVVVLPATAVFRRPATRRAGVLSADHMTHLDRGCQLIADPAERFGWAVTGLVACARCLRRADESRSAGLPQDFVRGW